MKRAAAALLLLAAAAAQAASTGSTGNAGSNHGSLGSPGLCEQSGRLTAAQQDGRLRLAAVLRQELEDSGAPAVLIARSGVDLSRFSQRYSHAGISLRNSPNTPWSVRQLYYACDEGRPRIFDQGLAGFVLAADEAPTAHVWVLLLPAAQAATLQAAALDKVLSLQLLADTYSANAYPFSTRYQNCNQWVAELLAAAWGGLGRDIQRAQAQAWLLAQGYAPHRFELESPLWIWLAHWVPLLHDDDHPEQDLDLSLFRVSMPASIKDFVQQQVPGVQRLELCQDERHIVLRRGWRPLGAGCEADAGDRRIPLVPSAASALRSP